MLERINEPPPRFSNEHERQHDLALPLWTITFTDWSPTEIIRRYYQNCIFWMSRLNARVKGRQGKIDNDEWLNASNDRKVTVPARQRRRGGWQCLAPWIAKRRVVNRKTSSLWLAALLDQCDQKLAHIGEKPINGGVRPSLSEAEISVSVAVTPRLHSNEILS